MTLRRRVSIRIRSRSSDMSRITPDMKRKDQITIQEDSGNVFADLGLPIPSRARKDSPGREDVPSPIMLQISARRIAGSWEKQKP